MTKSYPEVISPATAKAHLIAHLKQVRDAGVNGEPIYIGSQDKADVVIIAAVKYQQMLDTIESQGYQLLAKDNKYLAKLDAGIASADAGRLHPATRRTDDEEVAPDLISEQANGGRSIIERINFRARLQGLREAARAELGGVTVSEAEVRDLVKETRETVAQTPDEDGLISEQVAFDTEVTPHVFLPRHAAAVEKSVTVPDTTAILAEIAALVNLLEDIEIANIVRSRLADPRESSSLEDTAAKLGIDLNDLG